MLLNSELRTGDRDIRSVRKDLSKKSFKGKRAMSLMELVEGAKRPTTVPIQLDLVCVLFLTDSAGFGTTEMN